MWLITGDINTIFLTIIEYDTVSVTHYIRLEHAGVLLIYVDQPLIPQYMFTELYDYHIG